MVAVKMKTSVSLSQDVLEELDQIAGEPGQRSALIEQAMREFLSRRKRKERDERDRELYAKHADELNREALVFLDFQVDLFEGAESDEEG